MPQVITEKVENNEFLKRFMNFNSIATEQDSDEFVAIDHKSSHVFQKEILEANIFLKNSKQ